MLFLPKQPCGMPRIDRNEENFSRVSIRRCLFRIVKRLVGAQRINGNSPKCAQDRSTSNMAINIQDNSSYQANNIGTIRRSRSFPHIRLTCATMESGDNPTPFRRICSKGGKAQWCLICQIRIRRLSVFFGVAVRRVLGVVAIQCFCSELLGKGLWIQRLVHKSNATSISPNQRPRLASLCKFDTARYTVNKVSFNSFFTVFRWHS